MAGETRYKLKFDFESSLWLEEETIKEPVFHPAVVELSLKSLGDSGMHSKSAVEVYFNSKDEGDTLINTAEEIAYTVLGFIGFNVTEGIQLHQIEVTRPDGTGTLQTFDPFTIIKRQSPIKVLPTESFLFDEKHRRALYWIGRGLQMGRPDDQLSMFYAAAESIVPNDLRPTTQNCTGCGRPTGTAASQPVREFLTNQCNISATNASAIIAGRGDLMHGRTSAIHEYERFIDLVDVILGGLRNYFAINFPTNPLPPDISIASKARIEFGPIT